MGGLLLRPHNMYAMTQHGPHQYCNASLPHLSVIRLRLCGPLWVSSDFAEEVCGVVTLVGGRNWTS